MIAAASIEMDKAMMTKAQAGPGFRHVSQWPKMPLLVFITEMMREIPVINRQNGQ